MKPKKRFIKIGETEKKIIKAIGAGIFITAAITIPNLPIALKPIFKLRGNKALQKLLKNLERKRFIDLGGEKIKLTSKGRKMLRQMEVSKLNIKKPKEWDGIWHLVSYDIPEKYKKSRDFFRYILESNGFFQIQESLWVHSYPCEEEIAVVSRQLSLRSNVIVMKTEKLPKEKEMQSHFGLADE
ncbi:hypothetical protein A2V71_00145 [Candidatus Berkelbacteria bacterium RBG_13_40_8]|uniref:Transcriptional repressor PaaX-like central Cas2-like domain-containing protein n=1 Tax=Candidatus Berkelbacteria bacterium RBG_13_40_8 TaxID=1797467 RepID=A0A1F5DQU7_9BACT|nr:MAG: hypothetical protein A2V71_00145 [Candidatus Berkelbacteria bacterium RBG_13_40_8]